MTLTRERLPLLANLEAYTGVEGETVKTGGRTAMNDGGGGTFVWDASITSAVFSLDTLKGIYVYADGKLTDGCWVRMFESSISPQWFGAVGDGTADDTAAWTAMIALFPNGAVFYAPDTYAVDSIDFTADDTIVDMRGTGNFLYNGSASALLCLVVRFSGDDCKLLNGTVTNQALWDATNSTITGNGASVQITGTRFTATSVTLVNVPRLGFSFVDVGDGIINKCRVYGNFSEGGFTGTETVLFGISYNPPTTILGGLTVTDCVINTCVQGVYIGNFGGANKENDTVVISNNRIDNCWNHGVYNAGIVHGVVVDGNSFERCQIPVALTGTHCVVSNNSMKTDATGGQGDIAGISLRDPSYCTVSGNTLYGDAQVDQTVIDLRGFQETELRGNVIIGNTIKTVSGESIHIAVGTNGGTACSAFDNIIADNVLDGIGREDVGLLYVNGLVGAYGSDNKITGNLINIRGNNQGIHLAYVEYTTVQDNTISFKMNLGAANTLAGIYPAFSNYGKISNNRIIVPTGFGTNVALRALWETGTSANNYYNFNDVVNNGSLTSLTHLVLVSGGGAIIHERGVGVPNVACSPGSIWVRTDGGAGTTLYVKESATDATGFVGK